MLGEVEETIYVVDEDEEDEEVKVRKAGDIQFTVQVLTEPRRPSAESQRCCLFEVCVVLKV